MIEPPLIDLRGADDSQASDGAHRWQGLTKVQLPDSLPYIFSGMKVAAILVIADALVGEFIGSERGHGFLMVQVQTSHDTGAMYSRGCGRLPDHDRARATMRR